MNTKIYRMKSLRSTLEGSRRRLSAWSLALVLALGAVASPGQDEEETVESLYQKAAGFIGEERYEEASKAFERIFEISKGVERLFEDYGAQAGGLLFDYGLTLLPQQRWEEARKAFEDCVNAAKTAVDIQTPIKSTNTRENLAKYQLGYCEAQLGRHEEAIRLYDEYLAGKPSPEEVAQVRASFKLRYGTSRCVGSVSSTSSLSTMWPEPFTSIVIWSIWTSAAPVDVLVGIVIPRSPSTGSNVEVTRK